MKKLFNDGWTFLLSEYGTGYEEIKDRKESFEQVTIPHDWMIEDVSDLYRDGTGWYRKSFDMGDGPVKKVLFVFDGIYMDSCVYINGVKAGEWKNGYSQFVLDATGYVKAGENEIVVGARCRYPSARWYTGAGIYRNVWICEREDTYIPENGVYVHSGKAPGGYILETETEVCGETSDAGTGYILKDSAGNFVPMEERGSSDNGKKAVFFVKDVKEWDVDDPALYELVVTLTAGGKTLQEESITIGFKDVRMDADEGFFLNGRNLKLQGVCIHHDLGALGTAFDINAMKRRMCQFKEMGVNSIRLSHNVYDPGVLQLADEMGFLIISEAFDMWERKKTDYDYGNDFAEWHEKDVASWVRRDRDHVSVFMWSIGNEIYDVHADERGYELTKELRRLVEVHDPKKNAAVTFASNFMPWENAQRCAGELEAVGYNYAEKIYEEHHKKYPGWIIYGSETYSIVQSRGIYHFPLSEKILSDDDLQCSSLGNSCTSWGAESLEACICLDRDMGFSMGQYLWTGYDYIGEPTPYHTKNSYFGLIDTAGFCKDAYYVWKSAWVSCEKDPFVHIFPYWDFNDGQMIDIRVASNAPEVELYLNGRSLGRQVLDHEKNSGHKVIADYRAAYEKGTLKVLAYDKEGRVIAQAEKKSFGDTASLCVKNDESCVYGDLVFAQISALDAEGNEVENANDRVRVSVKGGVLAGLDNGDSTDTDRYRTDSKRLFGGKLLAIVRAEKPGVLPEIKAELTDVKEIRAIRLVSEKGQKFDADLRSMDICAKVFPEDADISGLRFSAINSNGTDSNLAKVSTQGNTAHVEAVGDGAFRLRCVSDNGSGSVKVISELEFEVQGIGTAYFDPYGYIYGSLLTSFEGYTSPGNEKGIATDRGKETVVSFDGIDFGSEGSDEITVDIFTYDGNPYTVEIWDGIPGKEGAVLLGSRIYQKPSIWNVCQPETWKLDRRLEGLHCLSFKTYDKMHIKGFSFTGQLRAFCGIAAVSADSIYGDSFTKKEDAIEGIGNNVTLGYGILNFGDEGAVSVSITGRAPAGANTLQLSFKDPVSADEHKELLEFPGCDEYREVSFNIPLQKGLKELSFIFLPGCNFDMKSFCFKH